MESLGIQDRYSITEYELAKETYNAEKQQIRFDDFLFKKLLQRFVDMYKWDMPNTVYTMEFTKIDAVFYEREKAKSKNSFFVDWLYDLVFVRKEIIFHLHVSNKETL